MKKGERPAEGENSKREKKERYNAVLIPLFKAERREGNKDAYKRSKRIGRADRGRK